METLKTEIVRQTKRILKKNKPTRKVWPDIVDKLIASFNQLTSIAAEDHRNPETEQTFKYCRRKVVKAFTALEVRYIVPTLPGQNINKVKQLREDDNYTEYAVSDSDLSDEEDTDPDEPAKQNPEDAKLINQLKEKIRELENLLQANVQELEEAAKLQQEIEKLQHKLNTMTTNTAKGSPETPKGMSRIEVVRLVNSIVDVYDGTSEKLDTYIQQITLLKSIMEPETDEGLVVNLVINRIKAPEIQQVLKESKTLDDLETKVKAKVVKPDVTSWLNKLKMIVPTGDKTKYMDSLKDVAASLLSAYIYDKIPTAAAEKLVAIAVTEAVSRHATGTLKLKLEVTECNDTASVMKIVLAHLSTNEQVVVQALARNFRGNSWRSGNLDRRRSYNNLNTSRFRQSGYQQRQNRQQQGHFRPRQYSGRQQYHQQYPRRQGQYSQRQQQQHQTGQDKPQVN